MGHRKVKKIATLKEIEIIVNSSLNDIQVDGRLHQLLMYRRHVIYSVYCMYTMSCVSYGILALALLFDLRENYELEGHSIIPCPSVAAVFLCGNSVSSFYSDVIYCPLLCGFPFNRTHTGNKGICCAWMWVQRLFGLCTWILFFLNWGKLEILECCIMLFLVLGGVVQLSMANLASSKGNVYDYMVYYTIWHSYLPFTAIIWLYIRPVFLHFFVSCNTGNECCPFL